MAEPSGMLRFGGQNGWCWGEPETHKNRHAARTAPPPKGDAVSGSLATDFPCYFHTSLNWHGGFNSWFFIYWLCVALGKTLRFPQLSFKDDHFTEDVGRGGGAGV